MIILGLKCYSHDTGAAIVSDDSGSLVLHAISEARLNRRKHSFTYPLMSIAYCLNALGLEHLDQVDRSLSIATWKSGPNKALNLVSKTP